MNEKDLRILVVYYSFQGSTKLIAQSIAEELGCDVLKLEVEKPLPNGAAKFFKGGIQVLFKEKSKLIPYDFKPEKYDVLFIGTPVWAWTYVPALRTFFSENIIKNKKIALFSCNGGSNGKTFENMKKELQDNEFLGEIQFLEPLNNKTEENIKLAKSWAKELILSKG